MDLALALLDPVVLRGRGLEIRRWSRLWQTSRHVAGAGLCLDLLLAGAGSKHPPDEALRIIHAHLTGCRLLPNSGRQRSRRSFAGLRGVLLLHPSSVQADACIALPGANSFRLLLTGNLDVGLRDSRRCTKIMPDLMRQA